MIQLETTEKHQCRVIVHQITDKYALNDPEQDLTYKQQIVRDIYQPDLNTVKKIHSLHLLHHFTLLGQVNGVLIRDKLKIDCDIFYIVNRSVNPGSAGNMGYPTANEKKRFQ